MAWNVMDETLPKHGVSHPHGVETSPHGWLASPPLVPRVACGCCKR